MAKINGIETEWTLLQRQLGNLPELEEEEEDNEEYDDVDTEDLRRAAMSVKQLNRELEQSNLDDDEERELQELKMRRLQELRERQQQQQTHRYSTIGAADYVNEVSGASKDCWVVCHLFSDGKEECKLLDQVLHELSARHPLTKFVRIQATLASPNFPDRNCPTLLIYHEETVKMQFTGLSAFGGLRNTNWRTVEWAISVIGAVKTKMTEPPRGVKGARTEVRFVGKRHDGSGSGRVLRRRHDDDDSYGSDSDFSSSDDDSDY